MCRHATKGGIGLVVALCVVGCQKEGVFTNFDSGLLQGGSVATGGSLGTGGAVSGTGGESAAGGVTGQGGSQGGAGGVSGTGAQSAHDGAIGTGGVAGNGGSGGGPDASADAGCPSGWTLCCGQCVGPLAGICASCPGTGGTS
jgi:hypothetical protein